MANLYKQYLRLLKKWPLDESKANDIGQYIRDQVKIAFAKGENSKIEDKAKCQRYLNSLDRLASNHYAKKYPCVINRTSTGITAEECRQALSIEFQEFLKERNLSRFGKFKEKLKHTYLRYKQ